MTQMGVPGDAHGDVVSRKNHGFASKTRVSLGTDLERTRRVDVIHEFLGRGWPDAEIVVREWLATDLGDRGPRLIVLTGIEAGAVESGHQNIAQEAGPTAPVNLPRIVNQSAPRNTRIRNINIPSQINIAIDLGPTPDWLKAIESGYQNIAQEAGPTAAPIAKEVVADRLRSVADSYARTALLRGLEVGSRGDPALVAFLRDRAGHTGTVLSTRPTPSPSWTELKSWTQGIAELAADRGATFSLFFDDAFDGLLVRYPTVIGRLLDTLGLMDSMDSKGAGVTAFVRTNFSRDHFLDCMEKAVQLGKRDAQPPSAWRERTLIQQFDRLEPLPVLATLVRLARWRRLPVFHPDFVIRLADTLDGNPIRLERYIVALTALWDSEIHSGLQGSIDHRHYDLLSVADLDQVKEALPKPELADLRPELRPWTPDDHEGSQDDHRETIVDRLANWEWRVRQTTVSLHEVVHQRRLMGREGSDHGHNQTSM